MTYNSGFSRLFRHLVMSNSVGQVSFKVTKQSESCRSIWSCCMRSACIQRQNSVPKTVSQSVLMLRYYWVDKIGVVCSRRQCIHSVPDQVFRKVGLSWQDLGDWLDDRLNKWGNFQKRAHRVMRNKESIYTSENHLTQLSFSEQLQFVCLLLHVIRFE